MSKTKALKEIRDFFKVHPQQNPAVTHFMQSDYLEVREFALKQQAKFDAEEERLAQMLAFEGKLWAKGLNLVAGVDEVGRGPLAGPVVAAVVVLSPQAQGDLAFWGLKDSKKMTEPQRLQLEAVIKQKALYWEIAWQNHRQIDRYNILNATYIAMAKAIEKLAEKPEYILVDGNHPIPIDYPQKAVVKGDSLSLSIAAASVLAKCFRDRLMDDFALSFPEYHFEKNKGYGSPAHIQALREYGMSPIHRESFKPKELREGLKDNRKAKGNKGEDLVVSRLGELGYEILERNFLRKTGEIDIIAQKQDILYFVEVRSKSNLHYGSAAESINNPKKIKIRNTAELYFSEKGHVCESIFLFAFVDLQNLKIEFVEESLA